jgi:hypothetical protein
MDAECAARRIQAALRRHYACDEYKEHMTVLRIRAALREIELRVCRMRYRSVIEAARVIHEAWAEYKLVQRLKWLGREHKRKQYAKRHGLDELFAKAIDLAIETNPIVPAFFVSNYILDTDKWDLGD